ncbi:multidrug ABC transporter permease/ATP-binding protein [Conservatibacter flavescens]|uniref:Multidrug ABC transporter permease/ATP-binding protein n=1 Tax=Conservatibacter flavescens TaxID=28161 RepID=A0A2M8S2W3_9PAST|nr:multidrug ABC transporter permease/ATP-binding protein [Conservatibacter flavescens]PJG85493.1 multidrug ABC transporter permease/ATP-binding protein [Conservatibacter flavescens]
MAIFLNTLKHYRWHLVSVMLLTFLFSGVGVGVLAFINNRLLQTTDLSQGLLWGFIGLLLLFLLTSTLAQVSLTTLGHRFVYIMRKQLVKQILDTQTEHLNQLGKAKLLASLSSDIREIVIAFVRLPELVQGSVLTLCASGYLYYLSEKIFFVTALWLGVTIWVSNFVVKKVYKYLHVIRETEDHLYANYQSAIDGHRELALNRARAKWYYEQELERSVHSKYINSIYADSLHSFANNWTNVMVLGAVGITFYLALGRNWADLATATTIALTILFLRTPLISAVGALPTILTAKVALDKLATLKLAPYHANFDIEQPLSINWQEIRFEHVTYHYPQQTRGVGFHLEPINLTLKRGEMAFLIGKNGSGKSTFSMLLAGLFEPTSGKIFVDGVEIDITNRAAYRAQISAIFSDFHLFTQLLGKAGFADSYEVGQWLARLQLEQKVRVENNQLLTTNLSQGQRKRLALLVSVLENRPLLILDEWAADQDPTFRRVFYQVLLPLLKAKGHTVFAISHDDSYFYLADRLFLIHQGKLRELVGEEREIASHDAVEKLQNEIQD